MSTRRKLLKTATLGSGAVALTSCERTISELTQMFGQGVPDKVTVADSTEIDPEFHLLSRAAFGPWPGDLEKVKQMGRAAWIEQQLAPERVYTQTTHYEKKLRAICFHSILEILTTAFLLQYLLHCSQKAI
jgi:hypothetical protein